jgi:uncharacterized phage protein (TIGR02218 family)
MLLNIAEDGTYHVMAKPAGGAFCQIASASTLTANATTVTEAEFRADVQDEFGLVDGDDGSEIIAAACKIPVRGTPDFVILGQSRIDDGGTQYQLYGFVYRIASEGVRSIVARYHFYHDADETGLLGGVVVGAEKIGDSLYFVANTGHFVAGFSEKLIKLPLTGDHIDLTVGSWNDHLYDLPPGDMSATTWWPLSAGEMMGAATIHEVSPGRISIMALRTEVSPTVLYQTIVNVNGGAPGTNNGQNDISALFGIPYADEAFDFAGDPSAFGDDRYMNPSINVISDSLIEIFTPRGYSDEDGTIGYRRSIATPDFSTIRTEPLVQVHLSDDAGVTLRDIHAHRLDAANVVFMIRENPALTFATVTIPAPEECASSGFDLTYPPCVTSWTQCVKIQRRDGVTFRFTSLDQDFEFRGELYLTCGGLDPSATQITAQLGEVGSTELAGLIVATGVQEAELYGGLFDDAFVEIWLVPYEGTDTGESNIPRRLAAGWAGKVSHSVKGYKMEVLGPGARLDQRPIVQVYSPQCRWVFGDERCTIDIDSLAVVGTVTSSVNRGSFIASLGDPISSGTGAAESSGALTVQFANGKVRWLTGVNAGQITEVKSVDFATGQIILWALTCFVPEAGDSFDLLPGCAQDFATCKEVYDNVLNFGGFPHVPGRDAIMESPNAKNS